MPKLSPNQQIFCDQYLVNRNGTQAYLKAYPNIKDPKTAAESASRMLSKNVKVKAYIEARLSKLKEKAEISQERVLKEEARIAFADIRKLYKDQFVTIAPGDLPDDIAAAVSSVEVKERVIGNQDGEVITERMYKYRLVDKGQALSRIEKVIGMYAPTDTGIEAGLEKLGDRLAAALERIA